MMGTQTIAKSDDEFHDHQSPDDDLPHHLIINHTQNQLPSAASSSSTSLITNKTVDHLCEQHIQNNNNNHINEEEEEEEDTDTDDTDDDAHNNTTTTTTPAAAEMTLEDFLAQPAKSSLQTNNIASPQHNNNFTPQPPHWIQYQLPPIHHPLPYPDTHITADTPKRLPFPFVDKTLERRQKRMIKNRESAARSRARKQAYTHELENKVSRLEEANEILKREQEAEKALPFAPPPPEPKYQLRRTSSALF